MCRAKVARPYLKGQGHTFSLIIDCVTIHFQSVILLCMEGFENNLAQVFAISRRCVAKGQGQTGNFNVYACFRAQAVFH